METKVNFNVMEAIETIYQFSKDSQLRQPLFEVVENEIKLLSNYLQLNDIETVLFANTFVLWFENSSFNAVFDHFGLSNFQVLKYRESIEMLYNRNLLMNKNAHKQQISSYELSQNIINSISRNQLIKYSKIEESSCKKNLVDFLEEFDKMSDQFDRELISHYDFTEYIATLCFDNLEMPIFREIKNYQLDPFETYFFLDTIWDCITCGDNDFNTFVQSTVNDYFPKKSQAMRFHKLIINKETKLSKLNLIEISKENFQNRNKAKLSKKVTDFLRDNEDLMIDETSNNHSKLIKAKDISAKKLFYNFEENNQLQQILNILDDGKFKEMQQRLKEKSLPIGLTTILHGVPGTGKTESVYQLAKESGRNIFKVDISETKSMWFGESQKLVKKIFTEYQEMKKTEELCPILLFNEADAIIGKRKSAGISNVADTENSIQNVILEEMEKFDGILFATTNLVENMDAAFERRFLFKVKFEQPSFENSAKIWQEKLPLLSEKESQILAEKFKFSGGEMENIARKWAMQEILENKKLKFSDIENLCKNEKWSEKCENRKIGF
ncbi:ATPase family associated with various cellular activities (AAA) [Halpernia humi]|uniref:ATPase family associated with various cellular activities (AAA) n=1 Tax=Halpernia humi TaxID=493375 RepID=A0A1H5SNF0_9FLAO|nr:ATP-binding protein [Halpernia humi]SEF51267.1 ATPase family associated with various cellular activities (AAA) [Halpernia humi]